MWHFSRLWTKRRETRTCQELCEPGPVNGPTKWRVQRPRKPRARRWRLGILLSMEDPEPLEKKPRTLSVDPKVQNQDPLKETLWRIFRYAYGNVYHDGYEQSVYYISVIFFALLGKYYLSLKVRNNFQLTSNWYFINWFHDNSDFFQFRCYFDKKMIYSFIFYKIWRHAIPP